MQTHIEIARRCRYVSDSTAADLDAAYEEIIAMLVSMSTHPEKWCP